MSGCYKGMEWKSCGKGEKPWTRCEYGTIHQLHLNLKNRNTIWKVIIDLNSILQSLLNEHTISSSA